VAAQVSRDKKRQEAELLAKRVAELEAQLVVDSPSTAPSTSSASPSFALPPTPASFTTTTLPTTSTSTGDALVERLQDENESLKTQLALEQLQSQSLQIRLSSLEAKFGRLEQLLSHANDGDRYEQVQHEQDGALGSTAPAAQVLGSTETDSSRLVAREDDISLPRKLSHPSFLPMPPPPSTSRPSLPARTSTSASAFSSTSTPSSASTLAPRPSTRPSLHQILSSITVSPPATSTCPTTSSRKRGSTGRAGSLSMLSRRRVQTSQQRRRRPSSSRSTSSTCSSSCAKTRLRLSVRR